MISLVPFSTDHIETLLTWFPTDADLVQWAGATLVFPLDRRQLEDILAETQVVRPQRNAWMAVTDEGRIVGHVQLVTDRRNGIGRLARVGVAPAERGRGYGIQMVRCVVDKAFSDPNTERVELNVFSFNTAALRTYERLGFVREGTRRSSARVGSERWDTVIMGLLRSEYLSHVEAVA
ncbi:N-acetyltransferase [Neorhizobium sp. P12A]|uniref:GNAT family N-acetyltransferase n=1 Tax=Neorhizobium sp. P12A TaxID=2268027 RepID=UPI0011F02D0F|nr:GNAT family protein [Neorhizobium sp. P12A]KAA0700406.1 N-acetyltransferase [Neorhizobium sp. P12A]